MGRFARLTGLAIMLAVGQFVVVLALAMQHYPGGNEFDLQAPGYAFWRNTFCDLGMPVAWTGTPNPAWSKVYAASLVVLFLAFGPLWLGLPTLFAGARRIGRAVRALGIISVLGGVLLPVFPAGKPCHGLPIGLSAVPGLAALVLAIVGMIVARSRWLAAFSIGLMVIGLVHFTQYVEAFWLDWPWAPADPATQKVAAIYALAWMAVVGLAIRRTGQPMRNSEFGMRNWGKQDPSNDA